jgi:hypothetical protein
MPAPDFEELEPLPRITLMDARRIARSAPEARALLAFEEQQKEIEGVNWNAQRMGLKTEVRDFLIRRVHAAGTGLNAVRTLKREGGRGRRSRLRYHQRREAAAEEELLREATSAHHQRELNPHAEPYTSSSAVAEAAKEKAEEEKLLREARSSHLKAGYGRRARKTRRRHK